MSNDPKSPTEEEKRDAAEFRAQQKAMAKCLIDAAILMGGNALRASLALRVAAEASHMLALTELVKEPEVFKAYDALHSHTEAHGKRTQKKMLAVHGIDYVPAPAADSDDPPAIDPALVN